jgi:hypothetical protein
MRPFGGLEKYLEGLEEKTYAETVDVLLLGRRLCVTAKSQVLYPDRSVRGPNLQ